MHFILLPLKNLSNLLRILYSKVQVVVATVAFGMGIDKLNVRRIIHYGWPQVHPLNLFNVKLIADFLACPTLFFKKNAISVSSGLYIM